MMRYLIIPGEILTNRYFSPLEKMILALCWNISKSGRDIFFTTEWLELYFGTKKEIIEAKFNNLVNCGVLDSFGSKTIVNFDLESIKNFNHKSVSVSKGLKQGDIIWQNSQDYSENLVANLVATYSQGIKEAPT